MQTICIKNIANRGCEEHQQFFSMGSEGERKVMGGEGKKSADDNHALQSRPQTFTYLLSYPDVNS